MITARCSPPANPNSERDSRAECVYVLNDEEIGLFSDEVVVNCAP